MKVLIIIYLLFCICPICKSSQTESDSLRAENYILKGDLVFKEGDYERAAKYFNDAAVLLKEISVSRYILSLSSQADAMGRDGKYDSGLVIMEKTLELIENNKDSIPAITIVNAFLDKAIILESLGRYTEAEDFYNIALAKHDSLIGKEDFLLHFIHTQIGGFSFNRGHMSTAKKHFERSLEINLSTGTKGSKLAPSYNNLAFIYSSLGDHHKAISYGEKSLSLYGEGNRFKAHGHINIASAHLELRNFQHAKRHLDSALTIRLKNYPSSHKFVGAIYNELANAYTLSADHDKGLENIKKAIAIFEKENVATIRLAYAFISQAKLMQQKGIRENNNFYITKSDSSLEKALQFVDRNENLAAFLDIKTIKAKNYEVSEEFNFSLKELQEGLHAISPTVNEKNIHSNPQVGDFSYSDHILVEALSKKLNTLLLSPVASYQLVKDTFYSLDSYLNTIINSIYDSRSKNFFLEDYHFIYNEVFKFFLKNNHLTEALTVSQKFKAKQLKFFARTLNEIPDNNLFENEKDLQFQINHLKSELISFVEDSTSEISHKQLRDSILRLELNHERIIVEINNTYFKRDLELERKFKKVNLAKNLLVLDFFIYEESAFVCAISREHIKIQELSYSQDELEKLSRDKNNPLLVTSLIPFLGKEDFEKITIIPDGPLWNVNFDLLLTEEPKSDDPKELPYLFKKYAISYAYSASLLFNETASSSEDREQLLAFSFGETDQISGSELALRSFRSQTEELPGTRSEIRAISELVDGQYYFGSFASERQFKEKASDYRILHLAVHGETDDEEPENSRLYFYAEGDTLEDGKLHAFELYNMDIGADLAVLSACNTGSGEIVAGEGIMSMGRAFAYAGVNSLLLTRWEVSDAFTPEIMKVFYRELKKGKRKSEALRQAKLEFLENSDNVTSDPFYWSSFYILGDDSPIRFSDNKLSRAYFTLMILVAMATLIYLSISPSQEKK